MPVSRDAAAVASGALPQRGGAVPPAETPRPYCQAYFDATAESLRNTQITDHHLDRVDLEAGLQQVIDLLKNIHQSGATQFFLGNGASAAISEHMALDWTKNGGIRSLSPSSWVLLTALTNDLSYEDSFAIYVDRYARPGDLVVAISSSGNSPNILAAIANARQRECRVVTLSGLSPDNASRLLGDVNFYVPAKTYGVVECAHQILLHMMLDAFMGIEEWSRDEVQNMRRNALRL